MLELSFQYLFENNLIIVTKVMVNVIQNFIELLYIYKTSYLYDIHLVLMVIIFLVLVFTNVKERQIMKDQENPVPSKCHSTTQYLQHMKGIKKNTQDQLQKLKKTPEFKRYLKGRYDPNSRFYQGNRRYDDVQEIVFSDEEDEKKNR